MPRNSRSTFCGATPAFLKWPAAGLFAPRFFVTVLEPIWTAS